MLYNGSFSVTDTPKCGAIVVRAYYATWCDNAPDRHSADPPLNNSRSTPLPKPRSDNRAKVLDDEQTSRTDDTPQPLVTGRGHPVLLILLGLVRD